MRRGLPACTALIRFLVDGSPAWTPGPDGFRPDLPSPPTATAMSDFPERSRPPQVSVVVASGAGGDYFLPRCLESLSRQAQETGSEVIVVDRCGGDVARRIERDFPWVRLVRADPAERASVPELRRRGVAVARGDVVAIIEEHCRAPEGWIETIRRSIRDGDSAIGGPILDDGYARVRDWVVYFSEYNNYLPPWPEGERYILNGANIAYPRAVLVRHLDVLGSGYWEVVLHPLIAREGAMRSVPAMGIPHTGPFDFGYYLEQRYLLSRVWGGTQRATASAAKRLVYLVAAPVFPVLLWFRIAMRVARSGRHLGKFALAAPLLAPVVCTYVWGEWLGYLLGPGDALERVE